MPLWIPITSTGTICGRLGSIIFSNTRTGRVFRSRRLGARVPTQIAIRRMAAFSEASRWWSYRLTDAQRLAWTTYARNNPLHVPCRGYIYLSGQQYFVRMNVPRLLAGQPVLLFPA